jgi:hypothetical protein
MKNVASGRLYDVSQSIVEKVGSQAVRTLLRELLEVSDMTVGRNAPVEPLVS